MGGQHRTARTRQSPTVPHPPTTSLCPHCHRLPLHPLHLFTHWLRCCPPLLCCSSSGRDSLLSTQLTSLSLLSNERSPFSFAAAESLVSEWQSQTEAFSAEGEGEDGRGEGELLRGATREECLAILHSYVDECVAVCVLEGKMTAPLPLRQLKESRDLLHSAPSTLIASAFNVELHTKELQCLDRREWLNDEVINFYLQLLTHRQLRTQSDTTDTLTRSHHTTPRHTIPPPASASHAPTVLRALPSLPCASPPVLCCSLPSTQSISRAVPPVLLLQYVSAPGAPRLCCLSSHRSLTPSLVLCGGVVLWRVMPLVVCWADSLPLSFFYAKLLDQGKYSHKNVARWTRKVQPQQPAAPHPHTTPLHIDRGAFEGLCGVVLWAVRWICSVTAECSYQCTSTAITGAWDASTWRRSGSNTSTRWEEPTPHSLQSLPLHSETPQPTSTRPPSPPFITRLSPSDLR